MSTTATPSRFSAKVLLQIWLLWLIVPKPSLDLGQAIRLVPVLRWLARASLFLWLRLALRLERQQGQLARLATQAVDLLAQQVRR